MLQISKLKTLFTVSLVCAALAGCGGGDAEAPPPPVGPAPPSSAPDTTAPTVTIANNVSTPTASGPVTFTFVFSEDVGVSFDGTDITVDGGTPGTFTRVDGRQATLVVTPTPSVAGTMTVNVAAGRFTDIAGNANAASANGSKDYVAVAPPPPPPPAGGGTVIANFDTILATNVPDGNGGTGSITATPPAGGSGSAYALLRSGGQPYALGLLQATVPFTADRKTLSARVYSPTAGIPMVIKIEGAAGATTGDVQANETVVVGWQTLTWTFTSANPSGTYNLLVLLPNLGTVDAPPGKTYYFDDITLLPAPVATPAGTVIANFDTILATNVPDGNGGTGSITATPPAGGSGSAYALLRSGGQPYALGLLQATVPFTADRKTLSARVYSPTAGIPMVIKIEGAAGATTGDVQANETVVVGWQTLTWTFTSANPSGTYNLLVLLPNLGTVDAPPGKTYYFDDITLLPAPVATPAGTVIANFDTILATNVPDGNGGTGSITATPPAGGSGSAYALLRSGGQPYALGLLQATVPFTADRKTLSARVYSPTAGIPMVIKIEGAAGATTGDVQANETVVVGWQTLTWTFTSANPSGTYNLLVLLPNLGTVDAPPGKTYYFDDITLLPAPVATPAGTVIANFDTILATNVPDGNGGTGSITATPPAGGSGSAYALLRSGGQPYALGLLQATVPFTADRKTLSARVYSPTAGIPMVIKIEGAAGATTGDVQANETVVVGWQTLTWTFTSANPASTYNLLVLLPNLGTVDAPPGKTYYFDDIKLLAASGGGGGAAAEMGSGGPQTLTLASGNVQTPNGGLAFFVAGEGIFSLNYLGSAEPNPPFNLAAWPGAKSASYNGITGIAGGNIGYFQDDATLSNSAQKLDEGGYVVGNVLDANGAPNFFRYFIMNGPAFTNSYMGLFVNAPNNGTVNVSSFSKIKFRLWGPAEMYQQGNLNPVVEMVLTGPKVSGCGTGSGGTEIRQNLTANQKIGAASQYTLPLAGFTVKGLCGADTNANAVANVLANLGSVVVTVPGTSFNFVNAAGGAYPIGVNLGPIGFTNN